MHPAAHALALNIKLLLQIHFYLTREEIYLTPEYYSENVWRKQEEKWLSSTICMLTSLSKASYVMVRGVYFCMIFCLISSVKQIKSLLLMTEVTKSICTCVIHHLVKRSLDALYDHTVISVTASKAEL